MSTGGQERVVLICVDESDYAENAFDYYIQNVMKKNDCVILIHVPELMDFRWAAPAVIDQLLKELSEKVNKLEEKYKPKLTGHGLHGKFKTGEGKPGEVICNQAKKEKASLIVLGTRGLGTVRRTILGSVSDYVIHHAHVPVLVCKKPDHA